MHDLGEHDLMEQTVLLRHDHATCSAADGARADKPRLLHDLLIAYFSSVASPPAADARESVRKQQGSLPAPCSSSVALTARCPACSPDCCLPRIGRSTTSRRGAVVVPGHICLRAGGAEQDHSAAAIDKSSHAASRAASGIQRNASEHTHTLQGLPTSQYGDASPDALQVDGAQPAVRDQQEAALLLDDSGVSLAFLASLPSCNLALPSFHVNTRSSRLQAYPEECSSASNMSPTQCLSDRTEAYACCMQRPIPPWCAHLLPAARHSAHPSSASFKWQTFQRACCTGTIKSHSEPCSLAPASASSSTSCQLPGPILAAEHCRVS